MPRVTIGNKEFVYNFKYSETVSPKYNGRKRQKLVEKTECIVRVGTPGGRDNEKTIVGTSSILQKADEIGNRVLARNYALKGAIEGKVTQEELDILLSNIRKPKDTPAPAIEPGVTVLA